MGQKWSKIRRRCSSFNTGTGKTADERHRGLRGDGQDRGPLLIPSSPDDSAAAPSSPRASAAAATTVQDLLRARLNIGNKHRQRERERERERDRDRERDRHRDAAAATAPATSTFYVPSPLLLRTAGCYDDAGPCSLPAAFEVLSAVTTVTAAAAAADHQPQHHPQHHRLQQPSSLCRVAETPSSCGSSSGRGTADDCAGSDRSSVSYSDHGYNSIASAAAGYADVQDR